jgi:hypothetical protein
MAEHKVVVGQKELIDALKAAFNVTIPDDATFEIVSAPLVGQRGIELVMTWTEDLT